jgi:hypothetical protein
MFIYEIGMAWDQDEGISQAIPVWVFVMPRQRSLGMDHLRRHLPLGALALFDNPLATSRQLFNCSEQCGS